MGESLLVDIGDKRKVKRMSKVVQHWKCPKCREEYLAPIAASMVSCKNGHRMKLVEIKGDS